MTPIRALWVALVAALVAGVYTTTLGYLTQGLVASRVGASVSAAALCAGLSIIMVTMTVALRHLIDPAFVADIYAAQARVVTGTAVVAGMALLAGAGTRDAVWEVGLTLLAYVVASFVATGVKDLKVPAEGARTTSRSHHALMLALPLAALVSLHVESVPQNFVAGAMLSVMVAAAAYTRASIGRWRGRSALAAHRGAESANA